MPTENRSSNTEMVSDMLPCPFCGETPQITKHHREDIYSFMHRCQVLGPISWGFREDQYAHIEKWNARAQSAGLRQSGSFAQRHENDQPEQRQGEPVAWRVGSQIFQQEHLAKMHSGGVHKPVEPLYTSADPGAVERLRKENESLRAGWYKDESDNIRFWPEDIKELHDQLAERDALLRDRFGEVRKLAEHACGASKHSTQYRMFIEAINPTMLLDLTALSASAEPSAPNDCAICRDLGDQCMECEEAEFREWADRHFAAADYRKTDAGVFIQDWMRHAYGAWCARGALARHP